MNVAVGDLKSDDAMEIESMIDEEVHSATKLYEHLSAAMKVILVKSVGGKDENKA